MPFCPDTFHITHFWRNASRSDIRFRQIEKTGRFASIHPYWDIDGQRHLLAGQRLRAVLSQALVYGNQLVYPRSVQHIFAEYQRFVPEW